MNLEQITMPKEKAQAAFELYHESVKKRFDSEDHAIMTAYKAISKGQSVISLTEAIRAGGTDASGFPKIAVLRAHADWCWLRTGASGFVDFSMLRYPQWRNNFAVIRFPDETLPVDLNRKASHYDWRAMVPITPPQFRPKFKLSNYHVLWEATWQRVPQPPMDPALLKHIGGDLYALLAIWELTPVERMVLAGRR